MRAVKHEGGTTSSLLSLLDLQLQGVPHHAGERRAERDGGEVPHRVVHLARAEHGELRCADLEEGLVRTLHDVVLEETGEGHRGNLSRMMLRVSSILSKRRVSSAACSWSAGGRGALGGR